MPFEPSFSPSRGSARLGVLVPYSNSNLEADFAMFAPPGVSSHFSRMGGYDLDEVPDAAQMAGLGETDLDGPLGLLSAVRPHVVLYGCTSATLTHGKAFDRQLAEKIRSGSGAKSVTAAGALAFALQALNAKTLAFASPYTKDINNAAAAYLTDCGFQVRAQQGVDRDLGNYGQSELTPDQVYDLAAQACRKAADANTHADGDARADVDALVLSCTDMRAAEVITSVEADFGVPVVTSNQAMLFQSLQLLGIQHFDPRLGHLFAVEHP